MLSKLWHWLQRQPQDAPRRVFENPSDDEVLEAIRQCPSHFADISVTANSVVKGTNAVVSNDYNAGATVTAGQGVYLDANSTWQLAQCDGTALEAGSGTFGIALHSSVSGQPLAVQTGGTITIGATVVAGTPYVIAATAGGIAPFADLDAGKRVTFFGFASTTGIIDMSMKKYTGVTKA